MSAKDDLTLSLFNGKLGSKNPTLNRAYAHWREIWKDILVLDHHFYSDAFLRQDIICCIHKGKEIVGLITASFFPTYLDSTENHSYLLAFPMEKILAAKGAIYPDIMSIEYLSVAPSWRKSELGISLGSVLLGLSMEAFKSSQAGCVLGTARTKLHVDEMCAQFGFAPIGRVQKYGLDCALIVNERNQVTSHPDEAVGGLVKNLWMSKRDYRFLDQQEYIEKFSEQVASKAA